MDTQRQYSCLIQLQKGYLTWRPQMRSACRIAHSQEVRLSGMAAQSQEHLSAVPKETGHCCHRSPPGKQAIADEQCSWGVMSWFSDGAFAGQDQILFG